jgi:5-methyltetrahydrofolate--homocysteine methyltransferase
MVDGRARYSATPDEFAGYIPELIQAGASFIGGCCGTRPDFIAAISQRLVAARGP